MTQYPIKVRVRKGLIALIVVVVLAAILVNMGLYTVKSGSVGVLSTFGKFSPDIKRPGLHYKIPFIQNINILDIKMQTVQYEGTRSVYNKEGVMIEPMIQILDSKNLGIGIEITVQYTPKANEAEIILARYGYNYFDKLINPIIRDLVRDVSGQYQAEEVALKRGAISKELGARLKEKFETLPFTLNDVQLRNIDLPEIVRRKIEEVQLAKQEEQRLAMVEKQARKNQEIKTIEAETKLIEVTTEAKASAEQKRISAQARAYQITTEAEALAKANKEIAQSITPELIKYEAIKRWSGAYPDTLVGENAGLLLELPGKKN
jgi:regulator of protease activity HflC (stomatin/prohibitin superfamily)